MLLNGSGVSPWGRRDGYYTLEYCHSCDRWGYMRNFNTRNYFKILYFPVIPLKKRRVVGECPHCRAYTYFSPKDSDDIASATVALGQAALEEGTREHMEQFFGNVAALRDYESFEVIGPRLEQTYGDDAWVLSNLAFLWRLFGDLHRAETLLYKTVTLEPSLENKIDMILFKVAVRRAHEGLQYAAELIHTPTDHHLETLITMVSGMEREGYHEEIKAILPRIAQSYPTFAESRQYKRFLSKARAGKGKTQKVGKKDPVFPSPPAKKTFKTAAVASPAPYIGFTLLILFIGMMLEAFNAPAEVYLLNGTDKTYTVEVDDKPVVLGPKQRIPLYEVEPDQMITVTYKDFMGNDHLVRTVVQNNSNMVQIINPDGTAILAVQHVVYADEDRDIPIPDTKLYVGDTTYMIDDIQQKFAEPRPQKEVTGDYDIDRVLNVVERGPYHLFLIDLNQGQRIEFLENWHQFHPDSVEYAPYLSTYLSEKDFEALLTQLLAYNPNEITWRRLEQDFLFRNDLQALEAKYRAAHEADPTSVDTAYLYARLLDAEGIVSVLGKVIDKEGDDHEDARWVLSNALALLGRIQEAADYARPQTGAVLTDDSYFNIMAAAGRYQELRDHFGELRKSVGTSGFGLDSLMWGETILATQAGEAPVALLPDEMDPDYQVYAQYLVDYMKATLADDRQAMIDISLAQGEPYFYDHILMGAWEKAFQFASERQRNVQDFAEYLLVAAYARRNNRLDLAEKAEEAAAQVILLGKNRQGDQMSAVFRGEASPDFLLGYSSLNREKALITLTWAGIRFPEKEKRFHDAVRRFNVWATYPYMEVKLLTDP